MKLLLIRRVETNRDAGTPGEPATPTPAGLRRLYELANICRENKVEAVVHSTETRAVVAAKALSEALGAPLIEQVGLEERNFGDWNDWEWPQIKAELDRLSNDVRYAFVPPNGESWQQMDVRLGIALQAITALPYKTVAVMTHYGPIRALLPLMKDEPRESTLYLSVEPGQCFVVEYPNTYINK